MSTDVGLALGGGRAVARASRSPAKAWAVALDDACVRNGDVDALTKMLEGLSGEFATRRGGARRLHIALLPPLCRSRMIELPPLAPRLAADVVASNLRRYFPDVRGNEVVGVRAGGGIVHAAVADQVFMRAIEQAAVRAGWKLERIVPADAAWAVLQPDDSRVFARLPTEEFRVRAHNGRVVEVRRWPTGDDAPAVGDGTVHEVDPWMSAALGVLRVREPELASPEARAQLCSSNRRRAIRLAAAAALVATAAAGVHAWDRGRELALLRLERAAIAQRVEEVLELRDAIERIDRRVNAFDQSMSTAPRWSGVLAHLARELPRSAFVVELAAVPDSMTLNIVAASSADAFEAVRSMPGVRSVRAIAPVQTDAGPSGTAEQAQLAARFEPDSGRLR